MKATYNITAGEWRLNAAGALRTGSDVTGSVVADFQADTATLHIGIPSQEDLNLPTYTLQGADTGSGYEFQHTTPSTEIGIGIYGDNATHIGGAYHRTQTGNTLNIGFTGER